MSDDQRRPHQHNSPQVEPTVLAKTLRYQRPLYHEAAHRLDWRFAIVHGSFG